MIQTHVLTHLVKTGRLSPTGSSRRAKIRSCPTCRAVVLHGDDADHCAAEVRADPTPLNAAGEVWALGQGRRTLALARDGGRLVLWHRYDLQILGQPAGTHPREDVVTEHRCHQPIPAHLTAPSRFAPTPVSQLPPGSPAPF